MADENTAATNEGSGASPQPEQGELISTLDMAQKANAAANAEPEGANNTGAQSKTDGKEPPPDGKGEGKTASDEAGAEGDAAGKEGEDDRFDKHPRFQQLIQERDTLKANLTSMGSRLEALEAGGSGTKPEGTGEGSPLDKIAEMDKDELADFISDNPHEYTQMILAQAEANLSSRFESKLDENRYEDAVVGELEAFAKEHTDFDPMWESGLLRQYMETHPGHNAISAYYILTADKRKGEIQGMIDDAVKKAEEKFTANRKAKNEISIMPASPSGTRNAQAIDPELQDTKKHGGTKTVLANRLARFRQAKSGGMM